MKKILNAVILVVVAASLTVLPACGALQAVRESAQALAESKAEIQETIKNVKDLAAMTKTGVENVSEEVKEGVAEFKKLHEQAMLKADKDQSGGLNGIGEWIAYLAVVAAGGTAYANKRLSGRVKSLENGNGDKAA